MSDSVQTDGITRVGSEVASTPEENVYLFTRYLAGVCDGAIRRDDVGFNGAHARFGKMMAETPWERWTPRQKFAMRRILETYKNTQLAHLWGFVPDIPEPDDAAPLVFSSGRALPQPRIQQTWRRFGYTQDAGDYLPNMRGVEALVFEQNYDPAMIAVIKEIPGRVYSGNRKAWIVPFTSHGVAMAVEIACQYGYDIYEDVHEVVATRIEGVRDSILMSHAADTSFDVSDLPDGLRLYPFQRAGVEFALRKKNVLIGDEMGLGKTPQAIVTIRQAQAYPAIVVCPASLKDNWAREAQRWTPERSVRVIDNGARICGDDGNPIADVTVINYDILKNYLTDFSMIDWKAIVADECHKLKNEDSQRHKVFSALVAVNPQARVLLLSGTPVVNDPMEFWSLIKLLGYGASFGGKKSYKYRYDTWYRHRLEELNQRARETFMVRRTKVQVLSDLPEKVRTVVPMRLDNRAEYEDAEGNLAHYVANLAVAREQFDPSEALADIARLGLKTTEAIAYLIDAQKQWQDGVYGHKYGIVDRNEQLLRWGHLKQLAVRGKLRAVYDWLDEFLDDSDQKIVVFVWHVETGRAIASRYNADFVYGGMKVSDRQPAVDRFNAPDGPRVIVGNIQAAGEGLNLQAASNVAFVEYGWNPKDHQQAEDRCHRIGQKSAVTAWYLAAQNTIEDEIAQLIARKLEVTTAIADGAGKDAQLDMIDELTAMLQKRRAA